MGATKILPPYSLLVVKGNLKGWNEVLEILCIKLPPIIGNYDFGVLIHGICILIIFFLHIRDFMMVLMKSHEQKIKITLDLYYMCFAEVEILEVASSEQVPHHTLKVNAQTFAPTILTYRLFTHIFS